MPAPKGTAHYELASRLQAEGWFPRLLFKNEAGHWITQWEKGEEVRLVVVCNDGIVSVFAPLAKDRYCENAVSVADGGGW